MVSIKDVAQRAGVSVGTASNVLNRPDVVSPRLRERVETAIDELGFVRNEAARHLRAGSSRTIAVVVLDLANPFFTDVVAGVEQLADEQGALVVVLNSAGDPAREQRHLARLEEQRVMGLLLTPVLDAPNPLVDQLEGRGTPVVLLDRVSPRQGSSVSVDDVRGGQLVGEHLLERGHRRIAFVGGPMALRQVSERLAGLRAAVGDRAQVDVRESAGMSVRAGAQAASQIFADADVAGHAVSGPAGARDGGDAGDALGGVGGSAGGGHAGAPRGGGVASRPTAVFCANDLLALGVLNECLRRGVRVPRDVALVGYDDIDFAASASVPLTSVRQPREALGRAALELLLERVAGTDAPRQVVFEPELVVRESSRRAPRPT